MIGPKTNSAITVHIAAARRAAQAALAETSAEPNSGAVKNLTGPERAPFAARGVQTARALYASHRRTVLLGVAIAIAATLAVRMVGVRAPFLQRSELGGPAVKSPEVDAAKGKPTGAVGPAKSRGEAIDVTPTASIAQPPGKSDAPALAPPSGPPVGELLAAIPPGISHPCATRSRRDSPTRNTNSRYACSKAGERPKINRRRRAGSNEPPCSVLFQPSIGSARCTRKELA